MKRLPAMRETSPLHASSLSQVCRNCGPASLQQVGLEGQGWHLSGENSVEKGEPGASKRLMGQVQRVEAGTERPPGGGVWLNSTGGPAHRAAFSLSVKQARTAVGIIGQTQKVRNARLPGKGALVALFPLF